MESINEDLGGENGHCNRYMESINEDWEERMTGHCNRYMESINEDWGGENDWAL